MASISLSENALKVLELSRLQDRIIGSIFGSALGDAIGLYTEFLSVELSGKAYPDRVFTLLPAEKATLFRHDPKGTARKFWATGKYNAAPNGSLMRTYALGIMCLSKSVEETFQIAADFSVATHVGPRCVVFCAIGTTLVRGLVLDDVYQERRVDELIETGLTWYNERREKELQHAEREDEPCLDAAEFRQHATAQTLADLKLDESYKIGYSSGQLCSQLTIFEKLITDLTMEGGDADTNACFAGALIGALLGYKVLPPHWRDGFRYGTWLMEKTEGSRYILGVTKGSYSGSRDKNTAEDGGRGFLADAQMEKCMRMQAWMAQEESEWKRK
ncbi:hypothetical protein H9L39_19222 [Fusarium oxysporum f. sp. albedinis]|nr:hypothetical protein H9L39_19222 [Fusarium oxysporum f. sp. albedinis]